MAVWFITGSSRGLGLHIAQAALNQGHQVVATARQPKDVESALDEHNDALLVVPLDVTSEIQAQRAAGQAIDRFGRIDVLVNNAGRGLLGAVEEATDLEVRELFQTNVFGLLSVTRAVLPIMRGQRSGHVLNISSVGGFTGAPGWGVYNGTKFAVEGISEAMRAELAPLGIQVTIIEPGVFRTNFLDGSSLRSAGPIADYTQTVGATRDWAAATNHNQPGDPAKAAQLIVEITDQSAPPLRLQLGADCVARVEAKLDNMAAELAAQRDIAMSTGFAS
ncbi:oxidoreductase [Nocardia sp. NPDC051463]|uniref:oxidoreductase n=1 Tax=Nocardia sp. NPDC051463 TaxID=3154845 RepID=UPI00343410BC